MSEYLGLPPFEHHEAGADAIACASVVLALARMRERQSVAEMWTDPIGAKRARTSDSTKTLAPVGGQVNYTTERNLRLADLPQPNASADPDHPFCGHTFCFTGELQSFSRLDAMVAVADCGATNRQGITKKTTYVVIGRSDSTHSASAKDLGASGKERKALDYIALGQQITVLGEWDFVQLLGSASFKENVLPAAPQADVSALPRAEPKPTAVATSRPASVKTAPKGAAGDSSDQAVQDVMDKLADGPRWMVKIKRILGLK